MLVEPRAARLGGEFKLLYNENFAFVWRMLLHFGVPTHQVEDAAQDVFVVVHRRLDTWDRSVSVRPWLYGICRRVAADHRRAHGRHRRKIEALPTPEPGPALDGRIADRQVLEVLERALARLDQGPREAFVMAEIEGMSSREIAEATGVNANTIYSRLRKAREAIANAFRQFSSETKDQRA